MAEIVSLWKAPHPGTGKRQADSGFVADDYPGFAGAIPDGRAYFAANRELAEEYAVCYGEGIIEVRLERSDYERFFKQFEEQYQDGRLLQVPIPNWRPALLNARTVERIYHNA
jgi:hypothetical protein